MPNINFVLPHWLYWAGLVIFPLVAMYLSRRPRPEPGGRTMGLAYLIWVIGGFLGIHRLYLKNVLGLLYWPLFGAILFAGSMERDARVVYSDSVASSDAIVAAVERNEGRIGRSEDAIVTAREQLAELTQSEDDQRARDRLQRKIDKEEAEIEEDRQKISDLLAEQEETETLIGTSKAELDRWSSITLYFFLAIGAFMLIDLALIPGMTRRAQAYLRENPEEQVEREKMTDDRELAGPGIRGMIDRLSLATGEFVAFWSVIAVFVYYYEVIARYVFNSPTNWAHESMFLMFGMQYLVCGAYAMLTESHVRVDIFYANFSPRGKALVDLLTSVFFFIFAGTLLATGWIFASDSIAQGEVSFTEWAIQYWPVKCVIVVGAVLLVLQGISKLMKDAALVLRPQEA